MTASQLLICVKCRRGQTAPNDDRRPGQALFDTLQASDLPEGITLHPVECLSNCSGGCTIALRGEGRWTYVYGGLDETQDAATLVEGARLYHATPDGLVPWRDRPEHFKRNCVARIPPMDAGPKPEKATE